MNVIVCSSESVPSTHRCQWIVSDPWHVVENGMVVQEAGRITHVGPWQPHHVCGDVVDHGSAILMPVLVNAHVHLELSALHGQVPYDNGFRTWVGHLLKKREALGTEALVQGAFTALKEMMAGGCRVVGEISTLGVTRSMVLETPELFGVWFQEILGTHLPESVNLQPASTRVASLAGHGPHTTAPQVLSALKQQTRSHGLPFSIHLAESADEWEFITSGKGLWADFLTQRGIDFSDWGLPAKTPVNWLHRLGLLDHQTLAVHLLDATSEDMKILKENGVPVCVCPRSNQNLHGKLPDIHEMLRQGLTICLGSDSLASTQSLDMFHEMGFVRRQFPKLASETILTMATENGARALGMAHHFGTLAPGKRAVFIELPVSVSHRSDVIEHIVNRSQRS